MVIKQANIFGAADHLTIIARVSIDFKFPDPPVGKRSMHWRSAPWDNMRGHLRTQLKGWDARGFTNINGAIDNFYNIVDDTVGKYIKKSHPVAARPTAWWESQMHYCFEVQRNSCRT